VQQPQQPQQRTGKEGFKTSFFMEIVPMRSSLARFLAPPDPETAAAVAAAAALREPEVATCSPCDALDPADRALADAYLDAIGETDPRLRAEYLAHLSRDPRCVPQMHAAAVGAGVARG
jgi:hypothetical protein